MTRLFRTGCCLLLGIFLWSALVQPTFAQKSHTLTIRDGSVYVDGRQLTKDQVPEDLNLEGLSARYRFVGVQRPVIELNGRLYAVEDGLVPVSEEEINGEKSSVILQEIGAPPSAPQARASSSAPVSRQSAARSESSSDAQNLQKQYLNDVQKANHELYQQLVRERRMEQKAQELSRVIRLLPDGSDQRQAKVDSLRSLLNEIFDLKQENRRREIGRLQREIEELQRSLQKRKQMRDVMIDRRLEELLGTSSEK